MNFKYYDVVSHLVSGYLLMYGLSKYFTFDLNTINSVPSIAFAYLLGYLNTMLSSWLEPVYYFTWGGKPSSNLLKGKGTLKVRFYETEKLLEPINPEKEKIDFDRIFQRVFGAVNLSGNTRVYDFNASYAFARNILTSGIFFSILYLLSHFSWQTFLLLLVIIVALWYRAKERGYYFAKEVLVTYINLNK